MESTLSTATESFPTRPTNTERSLDEILEASARYLQLQMLLIEVAACNESADFELIASAYHFADAAHRDQVRKSGEPFLQHCVEVARILAQLRLDSTTVAAGLLHDVLEDTNIGLEEIERAFGPKIATLTDGVTKIKRFHFESREARQAETYRKMLLSMVEDIRVILVKFADRLHNMRTLDFLDAEQQQRIAHETVEVYTPLAHRLGLARIRWELEDLSLKYLDVENYAAIRDKVAMKRYTREALIEEFKAPVEEELHRNQISVDITGRAKNFYAIYNKMRARNKPFEEMFDLIAVRIIVGTVRECYHVLGLVHTMYRPIPERFKDYVATPKTNMYQSLHTSVIGPRGLPVEVQIRTWEMHHTAEIGIAAHWRYKDGNTSSARDLDQQIDWVRQVLDWQRDASDPAEFMESLKIELFQDEIFVFTPKGDLHQLPKGATPIDFAFAIHTDIGLHCLTAKVNGQIVPLSTPLGSGDTVQIVTSPHLQPQQSWLEMVKTAKARQAIRRWLREKHFSDSVRLGQEILEREFKRYQHNVDSDALEAAAAELGGDTEHLYANVGRGDISVRRVVNRLVPTDRPHRRIRALFRDRRGIRIQGLDDLMIQFGKCCTPIPGDSIIGLITRGHGLSVHRSDCPNIVDFVDDPERLLTVDWDLEEEQAFTVQLRIRGRDRNYLLTDMTRVISDTGANIQRSTSQTTAQGIENTFWIDVHDTRQLNNLSRVLMKVEGVTDVIRVDTPDPSHN
ncbi:MAG: bifunctional (p)ppGpp synthetase/guanosine-3',5'-bis(diphosphate) 3'-pyrophosphohydrolase [Candidatus Latescibacterota bacterium]|nr:bifunctional (p)ppGpp synthetase/guanosine-3',5'-bis(diphosphate) 3'-pyrophosphohydrolase [Candidatus Latescibacterota bacterium]